MARSSGRRQRTRGSVDKLPSGTFRVRVYAGKDPVTGRRHDLVEVIPAGPKAAAEAEATRTRLLNQVDERRHPRTNATVNQMLDRHFELAKLEPATRSTYVGYAGKHIRTLIGKEQVGALDADLFDSFYAELRRCRDHCDRRLRTDHRTEREHVCDERCRPHVCRPLGDSTIRQVHFILSGALRRAVRWRWIGTSPIGQAEPPPAPKPDPQPPSAGDAARIVHTAWSDPEWALLLWLTMVTGVRRGELCALRWLHVDLVAGVLSVRRSIWQRGKAVGEKDTKDHQKRRIALDLETVALLAEHRGRWEERAAALEIELSDEAFVFSTAPDGRKHLLPDSVTQRYGDLVKRLGIHTSIHKLRHYSATELISAGVDPRTVAGRLGHGGGGTTTLRYYAAWVSESDQRAASTLSARMPARPVEGAVTEPDRPPHPYERVAAVLRVALAAGTLPVGSFLPGQKRLAAEHRVAVGTANRAVNLLAEEGLVQAVPGHGFQVLRLPESEQFRELAPALLDGVLAEAPEIHGMLLDLVVRRAGEEIARVSVEGDPSDPRELRELLLDAIRRRGHDDAELADFEMDLFRAETGALIRTFVASRRRTSQSPAAGH